MIPQHSSASNEHYTPAPIVEAARKVLGGIDLDPASCEAANATVQAKGFFEQSKHDGLALPWGLLSDANTVFLNPPGGSFVLTCAQAAALSPEALARELRRMKELRERWGTKSQAVAWWRKLIEEVALARVSQAIYVGFTLEILRTAQSPVPGGSPSDHLLCFPRERIEFGGAPSPTHGNVIVGVGVDREAFFDAFGPIGKCK